MILFGDKAEIWYLPQDDRPTTAKIPQWADLDKSLLTKLCRVSNVSINTTLSTGDGTTKCDNQYSVALPLNHSFGVSFTSVIAEDEYAATPDVQGASIFLQGYYRNRNVAALVADWEVFTTQPTLTGNFRGFWADWIVVRISETQPVSGHIRLGIDIAPAFSAYADPLDGAAQPIPDKEPLQVRRFIPDFVEPTFWGS